jgi:hypothetical protein
MVLAQGRIASSGNPAAGEWSDFFKFRHNSRQTDATRDAESRRLWGAAEQAATDYGVAWGGRQGLNPNIAEIVYLGLGDQFRGAVNSNVPGFDPRSAGESYALSTVVWAVAMQEQQRFESDTLLARILN